MSLLWGHAAQRAAATWPPFSHAPAPADRTTAASPTSPLEHNYKPCRSLVARLAIVLGTFPLRLASIGMAFKPPYVPGTWTPSKRGARMLDTPDRRSVPERILLAVGGLTLFALLFVVACRIAVEQIFLTIEQSRATGLAAVPWDTGSKWYSHGLNSSVDFARTNLRSASVSRSAQIRSRSSSFDRSVASLHQVVSAHRGYFDDLRTESHSGQGRLLYVELAVPSGEFDTTLSDLEKVGRLVAISEVGEDAAVSLANQARNVAAAETNLVRLQKLRRERTDKLLDVLTLEKEIAQANASVAEALRQQEALQSTVAQAHILFTLLEDYRAPLRARLDAEPLHLRNGLIQGVGTIFSSMAAMIAVLFEDGLPLLFWLALLFFPCAACADSAPVLRPPFREPTGLDKRKAGAIVRPSSSR
jgi:Domain of unknown function (DUF4349)